MPALPPALDKLVTLLSRLPGVGERSATRLAFFILEEPDAYARQLGSALEQLDGHVSYCVDCHMVCERERCRVCTDPTRSASTLCVVQRVQDMLAFERSGAFDGRYHVLHGVLSPLKGIGPDQLRLANLRARAAAPEVEEVILATSTGVEGEATALYLARVLADANVKVSRIATGIPLGGELEYVDQSTLGRALAGRTELSPG